MDQKREHDAFIAKEQAEFELGKQHLANMMGVEAETMTQADIDKAIEYLFPSGLQEKTARPLMKPPKEVSSLLYVLRYIRLVVTSPSLCLQIFPQQKEPEFDVEGRPFNPFFFTRRPNFVRSLHEIVDTLESCYTLSDRMMQQGHGPDPDRMLNADRLAGTRWVTKTELEEKLLEKISDTHFEELITVLERLTFQHFSYKFKDFIYKYRVSTEVVKSKDMFIKPELDKSGRAYVEALGESERGKH